MVYQNVVKKYLAMLLKRLLQYLGTDQIVTSIRASCELKSVEFNSLLNHEKKFVKTEFM